MLHEQGYLSLKCAAYYCDYKPRYFGRLIREYQIPRYGPKRNKFSKADLDTFMQNPSAYVAHGSTRSKWKMVVL